MHKTFHHERPVHVQKKTLLLHCWCEVEKIDFKCAKLNEQMQLLNKNMIMLITLFTSKVKSSKETKV